MNLYDQMCSNAEQDAHSGRIAGVVVGVVTNNQDPDGFGRVKVKFPWLSEVDESDWARIATPMAGNDRGLYFLPEVDDEVLIAFQHGDVRFPYVVGALWNGKDAPPANNEDGKNNVRMIRSRSGHVIKLNDDDGKETVEIIDSTTQNSIVIDSTKGTITIKSDKDIVLSSPEGDISLSAAKGTIKLEANKIEINSKPTSPFYAGASAAVNSDHGVLA
jgi:uncharacterized protein involved in type VI secretion and phage assembly